MAVDTLNLTRNRDLYIVRSDVHNRQFPPDLEEQFLKEKTRVNVFTHEGSLSRRVSSILRDDRENTIIRMLMLLRRLQEVVVTTGMMLVAEQGRAGCSGSGGSRMM